MNSPDQTFEQFQLSPSTFEALRASGYHTPTPIQAGAIGPILAGRDLMGAAPTGTGKTGAFVIPIIERLRQSGGSALVLAPTRELAEQIAGWAERLGSHSTALVVGGLGYGPQVQALRRSPSIVVATPGRLVDHLGRGTATLRNVRILVLDEADRMLDMGFKPQLERILRAVPAVRQTLLFSATLPDDLRAFAWVGVRDPLRIEVGPHQLPPQRATQDVFLVDRDQKTALLLSLIAAESGHMLVFARTKHRADRLARAVRAAGHDARPIHSNRSQSQRRAALDGFRRGHYRILIATDIAARGIDVPDIRRVVNYDLPQTAEDYVHRVGRTARAGADGHASSFAAPEERAQLHAIERHLGHPLSRTKHDTGGAARIGVTSAPRPRHHDSQPARQQRERQVASR